MDYKGRAKSNIHKKHSEQPPANKVIFAVLCLQLCVDELIIKIGNVKMVNLKRVNGR